jgi:hypothetical protein
MMEVEKLMSLLRFVGYISLLKGLKWTLFPKSSIDENEETKSKQEDMLQSFLAIIIGITMIVTSYVIK